MQEVNVNFYLMIISVSTDFIDSGLFYVIKIINKVIKLQVKYGLQLLLSLL